MKHRLHGLAWVRLGRVRGLGMRLSVGLLCLPLAACGSSTPKDAIRVFDDPNATSNDKLAALAAANQQATQSPAQAAQLRESLQKILWNSAQPPALRRAVAKQLLSATTPETMDETAAQFAALVAREPDPELIAIAGAWASEHKRGEFVGPLIRAAVFTPASTESVLTSLESLTGSRDLAGVLFSQMLTPTVPENQRSGGVDYERRVQHDAWTLLSRIDPTTELRRALVASGATSHPKGAVLLEALKTTAPALRVMPNTGEELQWLVTVAQSADSAWVESVRAAVAKVPEGATLAMRNLEPVRWASEHQSQWLNASREELLSIARERLAQRDVRTRPWKQPVKPYREQLDAAAPMLAWGDVLTVLVVDECVRRAPNVGVLADQVRIDRDDRTTEFGGLLMSAGAGGQPQFVAYPPRAAQRRSDVEFVASEEMITDSRTRPGVLAHYHFHAQADQNDENAGPSLGDVIYADRFGAACLVLTSVRGGKLNIDYYQPGPRATPIVIDLGTIPLAKER